MTKGTLLCSYCEEEYLPINSTAEDKELYCSQVCENLDVSITNDFED